MQLDGPVRGFLAIMADNGRLALLHETAALFAEFKAAQEASVNVEVISAFDVDEAALNQISEAMSRRFERTVSITSETDPNLLVAPLFVPATWLSTVRFAVG